MFLTIYEERVLTSAGDLLADTVALIDIVVGHLKMRAKN